MSAPFARSAVDAANQAYDQLGPRVLILDDDPGILSELTDFLTGYDFQVTGLSDPTHFEPVLEAGSFDLLILDVMLPGADGLDICKRLSASKRIPIVIISAMGTETDRIVGLELGADSYLVKPFNPRELLAHIRAQLRRRADGVDSGEPMRDYRFRGWRINLSRQQLFTPSGMSIPLSYKEFRTLAAFIERPMRILTRDQLLDLVHSTEEPYDRVVDVMVSRLRRKLMLGEGGETLIQTVRGEGYMFASPVVRI